MMLMKFSEPDRLTPKTEVKSHIKKKIEVKPYD